MGSSTRVNRTSTPKKPTTVSNGVKKSAKANHSILTFFKKTEKAEDSLFVGAGATEAKQEADLYSAEDDRFNEVESPVKRRRFSQDDGGIASKVFSHDARLIEDKTSVASVQPQAVRKNAKPFKNTPFVMDSDSEDEDNDNGTNDTTMSAATETTPVSEPPAAKPEHTPVAVEMTAEEEAGIKVELEDGALEGPDVPALKHEDSVYGQFNELEGLGHLDDFDPLFEGEELREMRFMREQARIEAEEAGEGPREDLIDDPLSEMASIESCPICDGSLSGVSSDEATRHVNACLDGNPTPLSKHEPSYPSAPVPEPEADMPEVEPEQISKRFARVAVPRPGQHNPLERDDKAPGPTSAFSELMSNHAEDTAWASAAASEKDSRGRPAWERTCPFYKIMPNFSICVDAFRYGAVKGCKAYFLSHFHSDHYIGLTANWRHGPIYCSKVTGSLVKQQLKTAGKWVVELEFEKPYDIPGTQASVTMIPANHCPGSSLFLFSKPEGKGPNSRTKRILHCGDFRACPAHVGHPLLKADIIDAVSGKTKQQKIDICYLDTTYLNPRYSFPPQDDVIKASADLCKSMSADPQCQDDIWARSTSAVGTQAVSKYFKPAAAEPEGQKPESASRVQQRLLVICGTYSIGKERICVAIAKALNSKIFASPGKIKICKQLGDPELSSLLTSNPTEAQVHMQMLMEIRAETLQEYLNSYKPHFSRIIGFRPSGWNFRPINGKTVGANTSPSSVPTQNILHGKGWRTRFAYKDFVAQRGSTKEAMCFGVPYSEHSSFRELAMFVMGLRIEKVIPTVNVGSEASRVRMKGWIDRWTAERRRGGLVQPLVEGQDEDDLKTALWEGKDGKGGGAWW